MIENGNDALYGGIQLVFYYREASMPVAGVCERPSRSPALCSLSVSLSFTLESGRARASLFQNGANFTRYFILLLLGYNRFYKKFAASSLCLPAVQICRKRRRLSYVT